MTPQQIRDLAEHQAYVSPHGALHVAPVLRALADLYECVRDTSEIRVLEAALKRLEELQP